MICTICLAIKNDNKYRGELVAMTSVDGVVVCYGCAKTMAAAKC